ncbi:MAG: helix-turn-helix domain-containing protein [Planctomycetota bacterium]|jgi:AraC-like DNA-binding protein|nr:helix-turn-helix domain-containing protein [Planctomycetota bacterium]
MSTPSQHYLDQIHTWGAWAKQLLGIAVVWKDRQIALQQGLASDVRAHNHPVCQRAKANPPFSALMPHINERCLGDCWLRQDTWASNGTKPFVFTCHLGLREYRAPVFVDAKLVGVWMLGPVKGTTRRPQHIHATEWATLPSDFSGQIATVAAMLVSHTALLDPERLNYALRVQSARSQQPAMRQALDILNAELGADLRAKDIARRVGLSPAHFVTSFKACTGHTFGELLETRLMRNATRLLLHDELPLRAIASKLRYSSSSYFSRVFRRHFGCTPSEFRRQQAQGEA